MFVHLIFFVLISVTTTKAAIPVLSANGEEERVLGTISIEAYTETLVATKIALDERILRELNLTSDHTGPWKLDRFSIGLGVNGEIGVGPYRFGTALRQRLLYSR